MLIGCVHCGTGSRKKTKVDDNKLGVIAVGNLFDGRIKVESQGRDNGFWMSVKVAVLTMSIVHSALCCRQPRHVSFLFSERAKLDNIAQRHPTGTSAFKTSNR